MQNDLTEEEKRHVTICLQRSESIHAVLRTAERGDFVLISGKGHEEYQEVVVGVRHYFSDTQSTMWMCIRCARPSLLSREISSIMRKFSRFSEDYYWVGYFLLVVFVVAAVSNGVNLTDGLDGLASGSSAIVCVTLAILAYLSGNIIFSNYLHIMYIPELGESVIFCAAFIGSCIGFLWYNAYPAEIFMGDTGSLALGGVLAVLALIVRKELLLPVLCGIFLIENLSVMIQVGYFKYTARRFGIGHRVFLMAPLHHHYQRKGHHESKKLCVHPNWR